MMQANDNWSLSRMPCSLNSFSFFAISFLASSNSELIASLSFPIIASYFRVLSSSLQENPMLIAVSILSPVKTQIMIPAYFNI